MKFVEVVVDVRRRTVGAGKVRHALYPVDLFNELAHFERQTFGASARRIRHAYVIGRKCGYAV